MRTVLENFFTGAGRAATVELEEVYERGEHVLVRFRVHARGTSSGAEAVGPPGGTLDEFERGTLTKSDKV